MACIGCGFELSPDFAFCPRCGRRQADAPAAAPAPIAAEPDADRRQVTVLFADITGFTTLSERLDPEDVRAFQNALFEALAQVVARYDGFVEKFVGDAVLAVFGAPIAHEDDPERAPHAALDVLARSAVLSEQWAQRLGQPVTLHIGVHTGPVVAGSLGSAAGAAYAVTGDTVNTTARLLAAASGAVLVSDATYALTSHRFAFDAPRELALRGKSDPVVVHSLVGALAEPGSARGLSAHGLASAGLARRIGARFSVSRNRRQRHRFARRLSRQEIGIPCAVRWAVVPVLPACDRAGRCEREQAQGCRRGNDRSGGDRSGKCPPLLQVSTVPSAPGCRPGTLDASCLWPAEAGPGRIRGGTDQSRWRVSRAAASPGGCCTRWKV
jgi:class 3 adenylate cyclase